MRRLLLVALLAFALPAAARAQCYFCGNDGGGGPSTCSFDALEGGTYCYQQGTNCHWGGNCGLGSGGCPECGKDGYRVRTVTAGYSLEQRHALLSAGKNARGEPLTALEAYALCRATPECEWKSAAPSTWGRLKLLYR